MKVSDIKRSHELYWDRPKELWKYKENGSIEIAALTLDLDDLLKEIDTITLQGVYKNSLLVHEIHFHFFCICTKTQHRKN